MAQAPIAQNEITKINIECKSCQKKLKSFLSKFQGVYSVKFDAETGRLTVTTPVDRHLFDEAVGHARFSAEIMCEDTPPVPPPSHHHRHQNGMQHHHHANSNSSNFATAGNVGPQDGLEIIRWAQMAELQKLPNIQNLKKLELTQSGDNRRIKLTFHDQKKDGQDHQPPRVNNTIKDDSHGPNGHCTGESFGGNIGPQPDANNARHTYKTCEASTSSTSGTSTNCGGGNSHNFEFQYAHTPEETVPMPAANNHVPVHTYIPSTVRDRVTVEHAAVRCEEAIASKCTIL